MAWKLKSFSDMSGCKNALENLCHFLNKEGIKPSDCKVAIQDHGRNSSGGTAYLLYLEEDEVKRGAKNSGSASGVTGS